MNNEAIFSETQFSKQNKISYLLYVAAFVILLSSVYMYSTDLFDLFSIILFTVILVIIVLIINSKFTLIITHKGIIYKYFPFILTERTISKNDIKMIRTQVYDPVSEFGGWGVRRSNGKKSYSMSGNTAIVVEKKDGEVIYFGTRII